MFIITSTRPAYAIRRIEIICLNPVGKIGPQPKHTGQKVHHREINCHRFPCLVFPRVRRAIQIRVENAWIARFSQQDQRITMRPEPFLRVLFKRLQRLRIVVIYERNRQVGMN
jgi:hypothetical protein